MTSSLEKYLIINSSMIFESKTEIKRVAALRTKNPYKIIIARFVLVSLIELKI
jgi:hypothetical protein